MPQPLLITGAAGMLGRTLLRRLAHLGAEGSDRRALDLADAGAVDAALAARRPRAVINCAAMTAVDRCEGERDAAFAANAIAAANLARACQRHGARLIHISTDYVFAGDLDRPYHEFDVPGPRTVYGQSKLAGEQAVRELCPDHLVARVAWLYGPGGPSFVHTMLKLGAQAGPELTVVDDQVGNPTSTDAVAVALAELVDRPIGGTVHLTCAGETSWHGLAREIFALRGLPRGLRPCTTAEFPRPAPRPANSRLEQRALRLHRLPPLPDWRTSLRRFFEDFPHG
jgi:dTDP-4-dehydrorhamnose reductase